MLDELVIQMMGLPVPDDTDARIRAAQRVTSALRREGQRNIDALRRIQDATATERTRLTLIRLLDIALWSRTRRPAPTARCARSQSRSAADGGPAPDADPAAAAPARKRRRLCVAARSLRGGDHRRSSLSVRHGSSSATRLVP